MVEPLKKKITKKKGDKKTKELLDPDVINFYSSTKSYFEFSNFYESPFTLDSKEWKTVEHYFQAQKSGNEKVQEQIRNLTTPKEAKDRGREVLLRNDWDTVKIEIMTKACRAKFNQNATLKKLLLSTENKKLREHTPRDKFWGDGGNGSGQNHLGKILMQLREEFRKK